MRTPRVRAVHAGSSRSTDATPGRTARRRSAAAAGLFLLLAIALLITPLQGYAAGLSITGLSPDTYFSPNGDGQDDAAHVSYTLTEHASVSVVIRDAQGTLVRTVQSGLPESEGPNSFTWDGHETNGTTAPNGIYNYTISGGAASATGRIGVDRRLPGTITRPAPNQTVSGNFEMVFSPTVGEGVSSVRFSAVCVNGYWDCSVSALSPEPDGTFVASLEADELAAGSNQVRAYVYYTDAFGQEHAYEPPAVPVTVARPTLELSAEVSPTAGPAPLAAKFKIKAKETPATAVSYTVDFGDGTAEVEGALPETGALTVKHTYASSGVDHAVVTVFDGQGRYRQQVLQVTVAESERAVPGDVLAPTISGLAREGETLSEEHGSWTGTPTSYAYQWLRCNAQGAQCAAVQGATRQTYAVGAEDVGHTIEVRETAKNSHGAGSPATSAHSASVVPAVPVNVTLPTVSGSTVQGQTLTEIHGTWTHEPTNYALQWLRCNGASCQAIAGATDSSYVLAPPDVGRTLKIQETAGNAGGIGAPATSAPTATVTATPLRASAGEDVAATQGIAATLDGSGSSPAESIVSYHWEFGDGSTGSGAIVSHIYKKAGTYTATLTVSDGHSNASSLTAVTVSTPPAQQVQVSIQDTGGQPLEGVEVLYISPSGQKTATVSDSSGRALLPNLPDGNDTIYAYKEGFQPAVGHVTAVAGSGTATIALASGAVATSTLKDKEMSLAEIEAAGIDTSDPANQHVYGFEVRLAFFDTPVEISCNINADAEFVGGCDFHGGDGGRCSASSCAIDAGGGTGEPGVGGRIVVIPRIIEGKPLIEWLILRGKVTVLKQFTTASLTIQNLSDEAFTLTRGNATLSLPAGLSLAPTAIPQAFSQPVADIPGGGSATSTWVVRGDEPGSYVFSADYRGQLEPFQAPVDIPATLAEPWRVWGSDAMTLSVRADSGQLHPGVPYHVTVGVTNKADVPLYNLDLSIDSDVHANFIFQPAERFHDAIGELPPGQTLYSHKYVLLPDAESVGVFNPSLSSVAFDGEEIHPGQNIEAVQPPPLYGISAPTDTPNMVHLHWEAVPGAEGYEIYSTPDRDTPFAAVPDHASQTAGGTLLTTPLPASATDAYLAGTGGVTRYYAVSALIEGHPTLESQAVAGAAGGGTSNALPEFGRCVAATPVKEGKKTVYHGAYTDTKCIKRSSVSAGKYEWLSGPGAKPGFSGTQGVTTFESAGKVKIKCAAGRVAGSVTNARTETLSLTLTGCERSSPKGTCQSAGANPGEIDSSALLREVGYIVAGTKPSVGIKLRPAGTEPDLASFKCGEASAAINGAAIAPITTIDKMGTLFTTKYKAAKGLQQPEQLEGFPKSTLGLTIGGGSEEQLGVTGTEVATMEEPLELKAL